MSEIQNTPCGCRCNSANDTRKVELELDGGIILTGYLQGRSADEARHDCTEVLDPFNNAPDGDGMMSRIFFYLDAINRDLRSVKGFLGLCEVCLAPALEDSVFSGGVHVSSPVVAESEADTSDAPAMTVQEGGGSDAAPGVEGVSPASSTPRFVVVGNRVYDRDANKAAACVSLDAARSVAAELNTGQSLRSIEGIYWKDAK